MKWNTLIEYPSRANHLQWEAVLKESDQREYRDYTDLGPVPVRINLNAGGGMTLIAGFPMQPFDLINNIRDAADNDVMPGEHYIVKKVVPLFDVNGFVTSYRHNMALPTMEEVEGPIGGVFNWAVDQV